jgi:hypothetical protein
VIFAYKYLIKFIPSITLSYSDPSFLLSFLSLTLFLFFLLAVLSIEFRTSCLLDRHSTAWDTPPFLFALVILETGSHFLPRPAWTMILPFYTYDCHWNDRLMPPCLAFFSDWDGGLTNYFCLHCPGKVILPISASQVARITGVSHGAGQSLIFKVKP